MIDFVLRTPEVALRSNDDVMNSMRNVYIGVKLRLHIEAVSSYLAEHVSREAFLAFHKNVQFSSVLNGFGFYVVSSLSGSEVFNTAVCLSVEHYVMYML